MEQGGGRSAFKPSGSRRTNLIRLESWISASPTLQPGGESANFLGCSQHLRVDDCCLAGLKIKLTNCIPSPALFSPARREYEPRRWMLAPGSPRVGRLSRRINRGSSASRTVCSATAEPPKKGAQDVFLNCIGRLMTLRLTSTSSHGCAGSRCTCHRMRSAADHVSSMVLPSSKIGWRKRRTKKGLHPGLRNRAGCCLNCPRHNGRSFCCVSGRGPAARDRGNAPTALATVKSHLQRER